MERQLKQIYISFDGKLVGNKKMKISVCKVLSKMPSEIVSFITSNCWFVSSFEDAWGFTFTGNDLQNQHLVFLSDQLWLEDQKQISYTIAHEIGHVILNHRNSVLERQSKIEIKIQEKEADNFAKLYI